MKTKYLYLIILQIFTLSNIVYSQETIPSIMFGDTILYIHPTNNVLEIEWGGYGTYINATNGNGAINTAAIVGEIGDNGGISYAAKVCDTLTAYGYTDWYLPSAWELWEMCEKIDSIFAGYYIYWSSNDWSDILAHTTFFANCEATVFSKNELFACRCIRREYPSMTSNPNNWINELIVYHDISDGNLNITIKGLTGEFELSVYNIQGQKIDTRAIKCTGKGYSGSIDVSGYPKGTYIIELLNGEKKKTVKFVI